MQKIFSVLTMAIVFCILNVASAAQISNKGYIEVEGVYYYEEGVSPNKAQRMAELLAYRKLAEEIGELRVDSETVMKNLEDINDEVKVSVRKAISGARIVSSTRDNDGNFHCVVRLNVFGGENSLANVAVPKDLEQEDFPQPKFITIDNKYTGLIVKCNGMEISTAIMPKIKSASDQEIYAPKYLNRQVITGRGMVGYADDMDSDVRRAGANPLIVEAMFISGECDVVVSDEDADKILAANKATNFLSNCMVIFVR